MVSDARASGRGDAGVPFFEAHFEFRYRERLRHGDFVWGYLASSRFGSFSGEPIVNLPVGMTIMAGQPLAHSLNSEPGSAALASSCSRVNTVALDAIRHGDCQ